jgi:hypothetical protein
MSAGPLQTLGAIRFALELVGEAHTEDARAPILARALSLVDSLGVELVAVEQASAALEARRVQDASRQRRRRSRDNPAREPSPRHVTSRDIAEGGKGGGVSSDPESDQDHALCVVGESEGGHVTSRDIPSGVRIVPEAHVVELHPLNDRARELALGVQQSAGPFDTEATWLAFQTSGKPQNAGEWQRWCVRQAAFAKRDRQREDDRKTVTKAPGGFAELVRGKFGRLETGPAFGEFAGCDDTHGLLGILDSGPKSGVRGQERCALARRARLALERGSSEDRPTLARAGGIARLGGGS